MVSLPPVPPRLPGERPVSFTAFCEWLTASPRPSLSQFARTTGRQLRTVMRWVDKWDWYARAEAWDRQLFDATMAAREEDRERARQVLIDSAPGAIAILLGIAEGRMAEGDQVPVLDRHGQEVGKRPAIPAATRAQAARAALELGGLTPPKRVELTGADGSEIRLRARSALGDLTGEQLAALARAFGVDLG